MPLGAWGFKSPLRHDLTRANALVSAVFGGSRAARIGRLSLICQQARSDGSARRVGRILSFRHPRSGLSCLPRRRCANDLRHRVGPSTSARHGCSRLRSRTQSAESPRVRRSPGERYRKRSMSAQAVNPEHRQTWRRADGRRSALALLDYSNLVSKEAEGDSSLMRHLMIELVRAVTSLAPEIGVDPGSWTRVVVSQAAREAA